MNLSAFIPTRGGIYFSIILAYQPLKNGPDDGLRSGATMAKPDHADAPECANSERRRASDHVRGIGTVYSDRTRPTLESMVGFIGDHSAGCTGDRTCPVLPTTRG